MTNNDYLKREYERRPWAWVPEVWAHCSHVVPCDIAIAERLKPRLPADLPEPPDRAYAHGPDRRGGVPLGYGRDLAFPRGVRGFAGWYAHPGAQWRYSDSFAMFSGAAYYILDLSDENAEAILEANRPKDTGAARVELVYELQNRRGLRVMAEINTNEQRIRDALIELGWTPPEPQDMAWHLSHIDWSHSQVRDFLKDIGWTPPNTPRSDDEWVGLDECEFQLQHLTDPERWFSAVPEAAGHAIVYHGPAAVRVRRKGGQG